MGKREYSIIKDLGEIVDKTKKIEDNHVSAVIENIPNDTIRISGRVEGNVSIRININKDR